MPAVLAIPGNHDIPLFNLAARLLWPYARYARAFGPELEPQFASDDVLCSALNTTRRWRHEDGEVRPRRSSAWPAPASRRRRRSAHRRRAPAGGGHAARGGADLLHGHDAAMRPWSSAGADLVLGGHIHLPYVLPLHERWPTLPRPMWVVQAGTAVAAACATRPATR